MKKKKDDSKRKALIAALMIIFITTISTTKNQNLINKYPIIQNIPHITIILAMAIGILTYLTIKSSLNDSKKIIKFWTKLPKKIKIAIAIFTSTSLTILTIIANKNAPIKNLLLILFIITEIILFRITIIKNQKGKESILPVYLSLAIIGTSLYIIYEGLNKFLQLVVLNNSTVLGIIIVISGMVISFAGFIVLIELISKSYQHKQKKLF